MRKVHPQSGAARDAFVLRATFPDGDALRAFDPSTQAVNVTLGDLVLVATSAPVDARSFRVKSKRGSVRRFTWKTCGDDGSVGRRKLVVDARRRSLRLMIRRAYLRDASFESPEDIPLTVTIGDVAATATLSLERVKAGDWRTGWTPAGGG